MAGSEKQSSPDSERAKSSSNTTTRHSAALERQAEKHNHWNELQQSSARPVSEKVIGGSMPEQPTLGRETTDSSKATVPAPPTLERQEPLTALSQPGAYSVPGIDHTGVSDPEIPWEASAEAHHSDALVGDVSAHVESEQSEENIESKANQSRPNQKCISKYRWIILILLLVVVAAIVIVVVLVTGRSDSSASDQQIKASGNAPSTTPSPSQPTQSPVTQSTTAPTIPVPNLILSSAVVEGATSSSSPSFWTIEAVLWGYDASDCNNVIYEARLEVTCQDPFDTIYLFGQDFDSSTNDCQRIPGRLASLECFRSDTSSADVKSYQSLLIVACSTTVDIGASGTSLVRPLEVVVSRSLEAQSCGVEIAPGDFQGAIAATISMAAICQSTPSSFSAKDWEWIPSILGCQEGWRATLSHPPPFVDADLCAAFEACVNQPRTCDRLVTDWQVPQHASSLISADVCLIEGDLLFGNSATTLPNITSTLWDLARANWPVENYARSVRDRLVDVLLR